MTRSHGLNGSVGGVSGGGGKRGAPVPDGFSELGEFAALPGNMLGSSSFDMG